jgi:hypothetical protein
VLSVYEGFFSGGARIVHSDIVLGLTEGGQHHQVLSLYGEVHREATSGAPAFRSASPDRSWPKRPG